MSSKSALRLTLVLAAATLIAAASSANDSAAAAANNKRLQCITCRNCKMFEVLIHSNYCDAGSTHCMVGRRGLISIPWNQESILHVHSRQRNHEVELIIYYRESFPRRSWLPLFLGSRVDLTYCIAAWHKMRRMVWYANVGKLKRPLRPLSESRPSFRRGREELRHSGKVPERYLGLVRT